MKPLSLSATYHLRRLLHQNLDRLSSIVAAGAGLKADPLSDLNSVIESLYLEEYAIAETVDQLERLASLHQSLVTQSARHRQELRKIEQEIFWLLGFKLKEIQSHGTILLVDDTVLNIKLLSKSLKDHGYEVYGITDSSIVDESAKEVQPDLILMDVVMPRFDGYEVCDRLKQSPLTRNIPILFMSGINDVMNKVRAFDHGGVDYVTKPFQLEELLARVDHHISFRNLQKRLEAQNLRLQQEAQERQETERLYRDMFENAVYGIFQSTPDGHYLKANLALARIYGYDSPEELITVVNDIAQQVYVDPNRRSQFVESLRERDSLLDFESQVYHKNGSKIWIAETVRKVLDSDEQLLFYEGMVRVIKPSLAA
ncbi:two-component response regulator [Leptolyngbya sp. NIES-3755]|nr:two-component response regulator [Leptolyngbya sp. NIES-3755]